MPLSPLHAPESFKASHKQPKKQRFYAYITVEKSNVG